MLIKVEDVDIDILKEFVDKDIDKITVQHSGNDIIYFELRYNKKYYDHKISYTEYIRLSRAKKLKQIRNEK
jgi:hypothetical protein